MTDENDYRVETDSMGEVRVPKDALYGAQTQRAVDNFPVSDLRFGRRFIRALGVVKLSAAKANNELDLLEDKKKTLLYRRRARWRRANTTMSSPSISSRRVAEPRPT